MLGDAAAIDTGSRLRCDVCIVGGGPAGIAMALDLAQRDLDVILLESGGEAPELETQKLAAGRTEGVPQPPLERSRLRMLGGTTGHWAGISRPLDEHDFEPRSWVPGSGWPIAYTDVAQFYPAAHRFLGIAPYNYTEGQWADLADPGEALSAEGIVRMPIRARALRVGKAYRSELAGASRLRVLLHANVTELIAVPQERLIGRVEVRTLEGNRFAVEARSFVLATGGIENARLLLSSRNLHPDGLGNERGLVGRYFMDHPAAKPLGLMLLEAAHGRQLARHVNQAEVVGKSGIGLSKDHLEGHRLLQHVLYPTWFGDLEQARVRIARFESTFNWKLDLLGADDERLVAFVGALSEREQLLSPCFFECEQAPNPDSRVSLVAERDALGVPRVQLEWRLGELERQTFRRASRLYAEGMGRAGLGRMQIKSWVLDPAEDWTEHVLSGAHHMGTTRMARDATQGVVNTDCRVFGIPNLYVAGSSVFPTAGHQAPTLTLVALALRLAKHLGERRGHPA